MVTREELETGIEKILRGATLERINRYWEQERLTREIMKLVDRYERGNGSECPSQEAIVGEQVAALRHAILAVAREIRDLSYPRPVTHHLEQAEDILFVPELWARKKDALETGECE